MHPDIVSRHNQTRRSRPPVAADFWRQIKRTVNGVPVAESQIALIVDAIGSGLQLRPNDVVCDIACGNGALSQYLFDSCSALYGSDIDSQLIDTALEHFADSPAFDFVCMDAKRYVLSETDPQRFTKALCYGSFSYFPADEAEQVLTALNQRFIHVERVYIGNLPDRDRADHFYPPGKDYLADLDRSSAAIGIWRSAEDWRELAARCGWRIRFHQMPGEFYAAHYRFDVILER